MRTTIDPPDDLHRLAQSIARDTSRSLGATIADLMRRGHSRAGQQDAGVARPRVGTASAGAPSPSERTCLPVVHLGSVVTSEDVRALEDDQA